MAGELSPDRNFYWDGTRWVSAFSPDGAWQWDGSGWRPARGSPQATGGHARRPWVIAGIMLVSLVIGSVGVYYAAGAFSRASQRIFQSGFNSSCASPLAQPGSALASGETLCGGTLGSEYMLADCTVVDSAPNGIQVWTKSYTPSEGPWLMTDVTANAEGCDLSAGPDIYMTFETKDERPPSVVVVADFTYVSSDNNIGMRLACTSDAGCIDMSMFPEGLYSLDEGRPNDTGWDRLSKGFAFGTTFRTGQPNRMILRLQGRRVSAFLNGAAVTQADTKRLETSGFVEFYLDNTDGPTTEVVRLQRLYIFEAR